MKRQGKASQVKAMLGKAKRGRMSEYMEDVSILGGIAMLAIGLTAVLAMILLDRQEGTCELVTVIRDDATTAAYELLCDGRIDMGRLD